MRLLVLEKRRLDSLIPRLGSFTSRQLRLTEMAVA
jgi:hypothetical protein